MAAPAGIGRVARPTVTPYMITVSPGARSCRANLCLCRIGSARRSRRPPSSISLSAGRSLRATRTLSSGCTRRLANWPCSLTMVWGMDGLRFSVFREFEFDLRLEQVETAAHGCGRCRWRRSLVGFRDDSLLLLAESGDAQAHALAGPEVGWRLLAHAYPGRGTGGDDIARLQAHELTEVADQEGDAIDHGAGIAALVAMAVHFQPQVQVMGVGDLVRGDQPGAQGAKGVAALALVPGAAAFELELALGYIVHHAVTGYMVHGVGLAHVAGLLSDHHPELYFPVCFRGVPRDDDIIVGPAYGAGPLVEDYRFRRDLGAGLGSMVGVVEANADELADPPHAGAEAGICRYLGQARGVELVELGQQVMVEMAAVEVRQVGREVADHPVGVE